MIFAVAKATSGKFKVSALVEKMQNLKNLHTFRIILEILTTADVIARLCGNMFCWPGNALNVANDFVC